MELACLVISINSVLLSNLRLKFYLKGFTTGLTVILKSTYTIWLFMWREDESVPKDEGQPPCSLRHEYSRGPVHCTATFSGLLTSV
jgi:hypothetical protein